MPAKDGNAPSRAKSPGKQTVVSSTSAEKPPSSGYQNTAAVQTRVAEELKQQKAKGVYYKQVPEKEPPLKFYSIADIRRKIKAIYDIERLTADKNISGLYGTYLPEFLFKLNHELAIPLEPFFESYTPSQFLEFLEAVDTHMNQSYNSRLDAYDPNARDAKKSLEELRNLTKGRNYEVGKMDGSHQRYSWSITLPNNTYPIKDSLRGEALDRYFTVVSTTAKKLKAGHSVGAIEGDMKEKADLYIELWREKQQRYRQLRDVLRNRLAQQRLLYLNINRAKTKSERKSFYNNEKNIELSYIKNLRNVTEKRKRLNSYLKRVKNAAPKNPLAEKIVTTSHRMMRGRNLKDLQIANLDALANVISHVKKAKGGVRSRNFTRKLRKE